MAEPKSEFQNVSGGNLGVLVEGHDGRMRGINVRPGDHVWLTEDEQIATANAPRRDEDNSFTNGSLKLITPAKKIANRRRIGWTEEEQVEAPPPQEEGAPADAGGGDDSSAPDEESKPESPDPESPEGGAAVIEEEPEDEEEPQAPQQSPGSASSPVTDEKGTKATQEEQQASARAAAARRRPPAGNETGATPKPQGEPPSGSRKSGEEVGTPEATKKG